MTGHPTHRVPAGHIVATAGAGALVTGSFLPWIRSGDVLRDSYDMLRVADDLGIVHGWLRRAILLAWFVMPAASGALVLLTLSRRRIVHSALAVALGLLGLVVWGAARRSTFALAYGAAVNQAGVTLLMVGGLMSIRPRRNDDV